MRVVILGAGISGHTAALLLRKKLKRAHEVVVVSPKKMWNLRRCLPWQLWRFIVINVRMTIMIVKSHHTRIAHGRTSRPASAAKLMKS